MWTFSREQVPLAEETREGFLGERLTAVNSGF